MSNNYPGYDRFATAPGLVYVTADSHFLCGDCANRKKGSLALPGYEGDKNTRGPTQEDAQWMVIGSQWTDGPVNCAHCNTLINPAPNVHQLRGGV